MVGVPSGSCSPYGADERFQLLHGGPPEPRDEKEAAHVQVKRRATEAVGRRRVHGDRERDERERRR